MSKSPKTDFCNRVHNYWNALSAGVVQASSLNAFKARLDKYWKEYLNLIDIRKVHHYSSTELTGSQSQN